MSLRRTQGVRQDAGLFRPTAPPSSYLRGGCPRRVFSKGGPMHISPATPSLPNTGLPTCALPKRTEKRRTPRPTRLRLAPSRPPTLSSRKNSPSPPGPRRAPRLAPRRRALRPRGGAREAPTTASDASSPLGAAPPKQSGGETASRATSTSSPSRRRLASSSRARGGATPRPTSPWASPSLTPSSTRPRLLTESILAAAARQFHLPASLLLLAKQN